MQPGSAGLLEARPCRVAACIVEPQGGAADTPVTYVLKDARGSRYMRLSEEGLFLWQLMDGTRTIRDLCQTYAGRYQQPPDDVMRAIARLLESRFIGFQESPAHATHPPQRSGMWRRILGLCACYWFVSDVDRAVTALHARVRPLYAAPSQLALFACAAGGLVVFAAHCAHVGFSAGNGALPIWIASLLLHVLVHEAAHATTCKHFGRSVHRLGVGWYYFAPVAFVDTSDCWAAPRRERIMVSAAGPYSNLVLSGLAALVAMLLPAGPVADALSSFCATGIVLAIVNMNPLLDLDGYYVAMDLLELPNLRTRALGSLVAALQGHRARNEPRQPRWILVAFGAASLAYGLMIVGVILIVGRARFEGVAEMALPHTGAEALAWMVAGLMSLLALNRVLGEIARGSRDRRSCV